MSQPSEARGSWQRKLFLHDCQHSPPPFVRHSISTASSSTGFMLQVEYTMRPPTLHRYIARCSTCGGTVGGGGAGNWAGRRKANGQQQTPATFLRNVEPYQTHSCGEGCKDATGQEKEGLLWPGGWGKNMWENCVGENMQKKMPSANKIPRKL